MNNQLTLEEIYKAYLDCRKNKRNTINALKFEFKLEENLYSLFMDLNNNSYKTGRFICFVITDPKPREIFASDFRDRIVHHILIREIEVIWEKRFIFDSYSCRLGKGTHFCVNRLKRFIKKITENHAKKAYYAQLNISGFFMSIDKKILYSLISHRIKKENKPETWKNKILWLSKIIIFNDPTENCIYKGDKNLIKLIPDRKSLFKVKKGKGLPIGNYSSQFFANIYLNELDQFVKRELKCKYYVRYVDDFILVSEDPEELKMWRNKIELFLDEKLKLKLAHNKQRFQSTDKGIDFLGYFIKPKYGLIRKRVLRNLKRKLFYYNRDLFNCGEPDKEFLLKVVSCINSYYGHFRHANSFNLRKHLYKKHFGILKRFFVPANLEVTHFKIRSEFKNQTI